MPKRKTPNYSGKLNVPLPPMPDGPLGAEYMHRVELLVEHYGIDPKDETLWLKLSLMLAEDHIRGFQPPTKGAPKTRHSEAARDARRQLLRLFESESKSAVSKEQIYKSLAGHQRSKLPAHYRASSKLSAEKLRSEVTLARKERKNRFARLAEALSTPGPFPFGGLATLGELFLRTTQEARQQASRSARIKPAKKPAG